MFIAGVVAAPHIKMMSPTVTRIGMPARSEERLANLSVFCNVFVLEVLFGFRRSLEYGYAADKCKRILPPSIRADKPENVHSWREK